MVSVLQGESAAVCQFLRKDWKSPYLLCALLCALALSVPSTLRAHGDLHDQIAAATEKIKQQPTNALLFFHRAELCRLHGEWESALTDCNQVARLAPQLKAVELVRGKIFLQCGKYPQAEASLNAFLRKEPDSADGLVTRARVLSKLNRFSQAVADYTRAIERQPQPHIDYYFERAEALAAQGTEKLDEAIRGLDEGMKRLGQSITFQVYAVDLEFKGKRYANALARVDQILATVARKEVWLARKGDILQEAGRRQEARHAYSEALAAFQAVPIWRREVKAMKDLEAHLMEALQHLPLTEGEARSAPTNLSTSSAAPNNKQPKPNPL